MGSMIFKRVQVGCVVSIDETYTTIRFVTHYEGDAQDVNYADVPTQLLQNDPKIGDTVKLISALIRVPPEKNDEDYEPMPRSPQSDQLKF